MSDSLHLNAATDLTVDNSVGKTAQKDSPVSLGKQWPSLWRSGDSFKSFFESLQ